MTRALRILEELREAGGQGLGLGEIAARTGLKAPTAHNLLKTLVRVGYARHSAESRRYFLGPKARVLGRSPDVNALLVRVAEPVLSSLQEKIRETVILAVYDDGFRHTLLTVESNQELRVGAGNGVDSHLYTTATGRVLLSMLSQTELSRFVDRFGLPGKDWVDVQDTETLQARLSHIRDVRFSTYERPEGHIAAVAAPLPLRHHRDLIAAIGVHYPAVRKPAGGEQVLARALAETAARIALEFDGAA